MQPVVLVMLKCGILVLSLLIGDNIAVTFQVQEPYQLREFHNYRDVFFTQFEIPEGCGWVWFTFVMMSNPVQSKCQANNGTATVYLQHDGYPIFTPFNETFPPSFSSNSSYITKLSLDTETHDNRIMELFIRSPPSGRWFVASYANPKTVNKNIRPQGFSIPMCTHFLRVSVKHSTLTSYKQQPVPLGIPRTIIMENSIGVISYFIPKHTYKYTISVIGCEVLTPPDAKCQFELLSSGYRPPMMKNDHQAQCDWDNMNQTDCQLTINNPIVDHWHYAAVTTTPDSTITDNRTVSLRISLLVKAEGCQYDGFNVGSCSVNEYYTDSIPTDVSSVNYVKSTSYFASPIIEISDKKPYLASFTVESLIHGGTTLRYLLELEQPLSSDNAVIYSCLSRNKLTVEPEDIKSCAKSANTTMSYAADAITKYYVPYPQSGTWYISVVAECYTNTSPDKGAVSCVGPLRTNSNVTLRKCVDGGCGRYGTCYVYSRGVMYWAVCKCKAGYRGYGCTDASNAQSYSLQMLEMLLLIISNILFAVAGSWAIYRKWFSEALIYFFVLFASSFYHACDNKTIYAVCVVDYSLLQYCDFYGSILAVWVTVMAMSELPIQLRSFLHVAGVLGIIIGTQVTLSGLWNFVIPLIIAAVILATSWARICLSSKSCFPKQKVWLIQLLPGILCALVGLALYSFVETESNYFYIHSIWHLLMATSIVFLLPRDKTLKCSSIKNYCNTIKYKLRRNDVADEREAARTQTVSIVASSDDAVVTVYADNIDDPGEDNTDVNSPDRQAMII